MTIAHLVIGGDVAGGQIVALELMRAAHARGHRALVIAPAPGPFVDLVRAEGFQAELCGVSRTFHVRSAWRLRRLLRRERVDVLHTHTQLAGNILGRLSGRLAGAAVVSHLHIENYFRPQRAVAAAHRLLDNATARLCARIVVVSEATAAALRRQGYPADRMVVVPNGVTLSPPPPERRVRAELGIPEASFLVGCIARLGDVKGQRELLRALALLPEDVRVVLVGADLEQGGTYERTLRTLAADLGVDRRTSFAGYRADVPAVLAELDVLALPSHSEGLPLVVLEAMTAGLPIVATRVGGTPEAVVDGETGYLVEAGDVAGLAAALSRVVGRPDRGRALGEAGRERARREFSPEAMCRRVLAVYDDVRPRGE